MRIIGVRVAPVAKVLGIAYAVFGLSAFVVYAVGGAESLSLPFGELAPLFHLYLNLNLARSSGFIYNIFLCAAAVLSYALTGWITGIVAAACFNFIAKRTGGIDAQYASIATDQAPAKSAAV